MQARLHRQLSAVRRRDGHVRNARNTLDTHKGRKDRTLVTEDHIDDAGQCAADSIVSRSLAFNDAIRCAPDLLVQLATHSFIQRRPSDLTKFPDRQAGDREVRPLEL